MESLSVQIEAFAAQSDTAGLHKLLDLFAHSTAKSKDTA